MPFPRVRVWGLALGGVLSGCTAAHGKDASAAPQEVPAAPALAAAPAPKGSVVRIATDDGATTTPMAETNPDAPRALVYDHGSGRPATSVPDAAAAPATVPAVSSAVAPPSGTVTNAAKVVAAMRSDFRHCYQAALAEDPKLEGSVRLIMRVAADGSVSDATGTPNSLSPAVVDCVLRRAYQAKFDAPEGGSAVIAVPITFVRREPDK